MKLLESYRENFMTLHLQCFLDMTQKSQATKVKINKWEYIKVLKHVHQMTQSTE